MIWTAVISAILCLFAALLGVLMAYCESDPRAELMRNKLNDLVAAHEMREKRLAQHQAALKETVEAARLCPASAFSINEYEAFGLADNDRWIAWCEKELTAA